MGSYLTYLWWGGNPDIADPISGMSKRDIYNVQRAWTTVSAKSAECGMELFLRLFREDPDTQKFFRNISGMPEDRIRKSAVFKAHVLNLMGSFTNAVANLSNPEVVVAFMNKLGTSHYTRRIEVHHFEKFKEIFIKFFVVDLQLDEGTVTSLNKFITFILTHIYKQLKE